ncbi:PAS domain S-box protein [Paraburkholderia sediminicola]|uniref:PAS domain-containing sensor histidine kinase n=1 Tax=Paraburkholderia TaxID=1822464 RepID=UPI0038B89953
MVEFSRECVTAPILDELAWENAVLRKDCENLERLLAERNELLHLKNFALNRVREAAYLIDETGRFVYVNEESCRTLGYSYTELLRMTVMDIDPDWTTERWTGAWQELREKGSDFIETKHRRKDGNIFPVEVNVSYFEYGGKEYNLSLARDVAERERARLALRESEQRYRQIFENVSDVLCLLEVTPGGRFRTLEINRAGEQSLAIPKAELIGKFVNDAVPKATAEVLCETYRRCVQFGMASDGELTLELPSGRHHYHSTLIPLRDESGRVHRIVGIARDITAHKRTESLLTTQLELEAQFRRLAESMLDIICRYDRQCRLVYANSGLAAIMRRPLKELLGKTPAESTDDRYARYQALIETVIDTGTERIFEVMEPNLDNVMRHYYVRIIPERGLQNEIVGALGLALDITERKEAEQRLHESYELLRELTSRREMAREEERKRIAREMHDELGQHLTALRMGASTLRLRFGHDNPALSEHVQKILLQSDKTMQVVRDVVSSLRPAVLDAGIAAALEWLAAEFSNNGQRICRLCVPEECPELTEDRAIALFRVVQEALTNITRHADAKQVSIALEQRGCHYLLEVRDDGRGFDPVEIRKKSFGLAGMKERVLMLGGEIDIASSPDHGTSIKVRVPIRQVPGAS